MRTAPLTCLAVLLAGSTFAAPAAAESRWFPGTSQPVANALHAPSSAAEAHLRSRAVELGLDRVDLALKRVVNVGPSRVVRFTQTVGGVPVIGGGVVVRLAPDGSVERVIVDVAPEMSVDPTPTLDARRAHGALEDSMGVTLPDSKKEKLVVARVGGGTLVWQLDLADAPGGTRYWVDAHDGSLVARFSLALDAMGTVYSSNSVETPTPVNVELPLLDTAANPIHLNGWGGLLTVANYVSGNSQNGYVIEQTVVPTAGQDFFYTRPANASDPTDAFAQVNLYYHLTTVRSLFQELGADVDGPTWKLTAVANALENGQPLDNAFFSQMGIGGELGSPNLIAIGQGSVNDFAYDSDVFKHEFGHYVSHNHAGYNLGQAYFDELGLSPFSGSIDEGIADYFACSDNDDAELGEASLELLNSGRDLTDTSRKCPDDMFGEVHMDGEIIGSFGWSLREEFGREVADQLVFGAISSLPEGGDFDDFAQGILATAEALVASDQLSDTDIPTIEAHLAARGLDNCGRIIALAPGEKSRGTVFGLDLVGQLLGASCAQAQEFGVELPGLFHYSWTPSPGDTGVRFAVEAAASGPGDVDYTIHARVNQPVSFESPQGLPQVSDSDYDVAHTIEAGELVIDASSDPPFDPSATYDFILVSRSCPSLALEVEASAYEPPVNEGGGGAGGASEGGAAEGGNGRGGGTPSDSDSEEDDGCGCVVAGGASGTPLSALLGLGALVLFGARRRSSRR